MVTQKATNPFSIGGTGSSTDPHLYKSSADLRAGLAWDREMRPPTKNGYPRVKSGWHSLTPEAQQRCWKAQSQIQRKWQATLTKEVQELLAEWEQ